MGIKACDISEIIKSQIENYNMKVTADTVGYVIECGDGIARISGLDDCMQGELLKFEDGEFGMAMNLEEDSIACVILGDDANIKEGTKVYGTSRGIEIPVGSEVLGRVISPLGEPLDGKGEILSKKTRPVESKATGVIDRKSVSVPLETGILAIDSMIPIGRGQRELIIGDRGTGKSAIAVDAIINQKGKGVICIYVAIGQKASTVANIINKLEETGSMEYTVIVSSTASQKESLQYIAPYAGVAIAEEFMYNDHKDVLIVYDDLSKHAIAYRAMSLLLKRPPGREAYPGDVFYLHSRLLERAARISDELGGGSITALPIIETQAQDVSAYIPTNVISITDGQIYLEQELFNAGQRPAISVGLSVSRVGGAAQIKAMKKVSGTLRMTLAQYRELAVFAQFGSDLDKTTRETLMQGEKIMEVLKQDQYMPIEQQEQVVILYIAMNKYLMDVETKDVRKFVKDFIVYIKENYPKIISSIHDTGELTVGTEDMIKKAVVEFKESTKGGFTDHGKDEGDQVKDK
ncbi:MAG: F0F1 ATP synthase subunit alpha [Clostridiales bacterium]|nr:F0F1 ATP synthase subunit alpha [Clostridiales bacterium]